MHVSWIILFGLFLKAVSNAGVARTSSTNSQRQPSRRQYTGTQRTASLRRGESQKKSHQKTTSFQRTASLKATSNGQERLKKNAEKEHTNNKSTSAKKTPFSVCVLPIKRNVNYLDTEKSAAKPNSHDSYHSKSNDPQSCNALNVTMNVVCPVSKQPTVGTFRNHEEISTNQMSPYNPNLNSPKNEIPQCSIPLASISTTTVSTSSPTSENQNSTTLTRKNSVNRKESGLIAQPTAPITIIEINGNSLDKCNDKFSNSVSDKLLTENNEMDPLKGLLEIIEGYDSAIISISIKNVNFDANKAEQLLKNLVAVQDLNASVLKRFSSRLPFIYNDFIDYVDFLLFNGNHQKFALFKSIKKSKKFGKLLKHFSDDKISNADKQNAALELFSIVFDKEITNSFYCSSDIYRLKNDFIEFFKNQFRLLQRHKKNLTCFLEKMICVYLESLESQIYVNSTLFTTVEPTQCCESPSQIIKKGIEKFSFISDRYRNHLIEFFTNNEAAFIGSFNKKQLQKKLKSFLKSKKVGIPNLLDFFVPLKVSVVLINCTVADNAFNNGEKKRLSIPISQSMPNGIDSLVALLNSPVHTESKFEITSSVVTESTEDLSIKKKKDKNIFTQCLCLTKR